MKKKLQTIPTKKQNPKGLHKRYFIQKIDLRLRYIKVDNDAEYFVMRLDAGGSDIKHIEACRKAVLYYAELIKFHLPDLSKDLIERYSS